MGSTSALTSHLQLNTTHCSFKCLNSCKNQRNSVRFNPRKPSFGASRRRGHDKFINVSCFAVDDEVIQQQQKLGGGGVSSAVEDKPDVVDGSRKSTLQNDDDPNKDGSALYDFLYPNKELLPDDKEMSIFDHLEELRQRIFVSVLAVGAAILGCFAFSKELILVLEAPVKEQGVRFLQLAPGEFFFTTLKVPVIQLLLGQVGLVTGDQMLSIWRYVVVGAVVAAAVLTPSTDPLTQMLLAGPLLGLYLGGAWMVKLTGR
ncbi:hypothetical protein U1Q18_029619 [Sarracenia purpurea var. burkii]